MSQKTSNSESRNSSGDGVTNNVIDMEQLQALTNKYLVEMVNRVSAMFPMRGLREVLSFQSNEFATNLFQAILTILEKKEQEVGEEKGKNKKAYQELKKQLKHTLKKMVENIEKWGTPLEEIEQGEETSGEIIAPLSQKVAEKLIIGGVKEEQKQSFPILREKGEDTVMTEESQKLIKTLGEQRENYSPFIYASRDEEIIHLRGQVEGLTRIIDRIKPLIETDPRYKVIIFVGNKGKTTTKEISNALGLNEQKLSRLLKELKKLEIINIDTNGEIYLNTH